MNTQNQSNEELVTVSNEYWNGLRESLEKLYENPDFQKVIVNGYFKENAVRLVSMLAHPSTIGTPGARAEINETLVAISRLQDYFLVIRSMGTSIFDSEEDDIEQSEPTSM